MTLPTRIFRVWRTEKGEPKGSFIGAEDGGEHIAALYPSPDYSQGEIVALAIVDRMVVAYNVYSILQDALKDAEKKVNDLQLANFEEYYIDFVDKDEVREIFKELTERIR